MYIDKIYVKIFCFLSGIFAVVLPCLILIATGVVSTEIKCFAIDSTDRIYVGRARKIDVYEDGVLVDSFSAKTAKAYAFTILPDDTILLSTSTIVYSMDLEGNVLNSYTDTGTYDTLRGESEVFTTQSGDVYKLKGKFVWPRIVKNSDEVVYKISIGAFIIRFILCVSVICFVVFLIGHVIIPALTQEKTSLKQSP